MTFMSCLHNVDQSFIGSDLNSFGTNKSLLLSDLIVYCCLDHFKISHKYLDLYASIFLNKIRKPRC